MGHISLATRPPDCTRPSNGRCSTDWSPPPRSSTCAGSGTKSSPTGGVYTGNFYEFALIDHSSGRITLNVPADDWAAHQGLPGGITA